MSKCDRKIEWKFLEYIFWEKVRLLLLKMEPNSANKPIEEERWNYLKKKLSDVDLEISKIEKKSKNVDNITWMNTNQSEIK